MRVDATSEAAPVTPAEELHKAAAKLRGLAEKATGGPWSAGEWSEEHGFFYQYGDFGWYVTGPAGSPELEDSEEGKGDARWIATMSPAVAEPLASWLEFESEQVDRSPGRAPCVLSALEFARLINGEG